MTKQVEVVIIGGGQAGLALSYYLTQQGRTHLVLEQGRVGETWRSWALGFVHPDHAELDDPASWFSISGRRSRWLSCHGKTSWRTSSSTLHPFMPRSNAVSGSQPSDSNQEVMATW